VPVRPRRWPATLDWTPRSSSAARRPGANGQAGWRRENWPAGWLVRHAFVFFRAMLLVECYRGHGSGRWWPMTLGASGQPRVLADVTLGYNAYKAIGPQFFLEAAGRALAPIASTARARNSKVDAVRFKKRDPTLQFERRCNVRKLLDTRQLSEIPLGPKFSHGL